MSSCNIKFGPRLMSSYERIRFFVPFIPFDPLHLYLCWGGGPFVIIIHKSCARRGDLY